LRSFGGAPWPRSQAYSPDHLALRVRSVDRLFVPAGNVPRSMAQGQVIGFPLDRGSRFPRRRCWGRWAAAVWRRIDRFRLEQDIPIVRFKKREVKEDIARKYLRGIGFKALDDGFAAARTRPPWRPSGGGSRPRMFTRSSRVGNPHCRARSHDQARRYGYDLAFRQLVISDTRVFDRPAAGRAWFERMLPDQLTLGRPDQIAIVFARHVSRCIPGRSHTKDHHLRRAALNPRRRRHPAQA
jgi:hypothetical protein